MFELTVSSGFCAAHRLPKHKGKCKDLHGHNYDVEIALRGPELDDQGMLVDFSIVKNTLDSLISQVDHKYLNKLTHLSELFENPTAEHIAEWFAVNLAEAFLEKDHYVHYVQVKETDRSSARYYP